MHTMSPRVTVGLDATNGRWVAVVLVDGRFEDARVVASAPETLARWPHAAAYGIDIPIGLVDGLREADQEARAALRGSGRTSSVFAAPCASAILQATLVDGDRVQRQLMNRGLSAHSWALKQRIVDAAMIAHDARVHEIHPELVFARLAHAPVASKKTWNGALMRMRLLKESGVTLPERISSDGGGVPIDDLLDAAAGALAVHHHLDGHARRYPGTPTQHDASGRLIYMIG